MGRLWAAIGLMVVYGLAPEALRADPIAFGGGGSPTTDCLTALFGEPNYPATKPRDVHCADGEPCDADGVVNGECQIPLGVCLNSLFDSARCTATGVASVTVDHALDNGDLKFDPEFQALQTRIDSIEFPSSTQDECTIPTNFRVKVTGPFYRDSCRRGSKVVRLVTRSTPVSGRVVQDRDMVRLQCDPSPTLGCDPQVFYTDTLDRLQKQVFSQSCALSGCHDSQSQAGTLLLEEGASFGNLVGVTPSNGAAGVAGWQRVTPGDPEMSFLFHKLKGSLPDASYGVRMPRDRPRLNPFLVDLIKRWITAGAPGTGWVPGTD